VHRQMADFLRLLWSDYSLPIVPLLSILAMNRIVVSPTKESNGSHLGNHSAHNCMHRSEVDMMKALKAGKDDFRYIRNHV